MESIDAAGNQWFTLAGESERAVLIGGHLDSVPNGGWLDGALNVVAGAEVLRRVAGDGTPPVTVRLVNWADEEGARFGRSLFGSSAAAGSMARPGRAARAEGRATASRFPDALAAYGVDLDRALDARSELDSAAAYLELHIEQGPVLESLGLPLGVVLGTFGVERHRITWRGQAAHAGSTPMDKRRDALAGAAKLALEIREIARAHRWRSGLHVRRRRLQARNRDLGRRDRRAAPRPASPRRARLATMLAEAKAASERFAERGVDRRGRGRGSGRSSRSSSTRRCSGSARRRSREVAGTPHRLPSGPLHDAAEVSRAGVPTVMLFVQSLRGLSHTKLEDTKEEHLELAVAALDRLASKTIAWVAGGGGRDALRRRRPRHAASSPDSRSAAA